MRYYAQFICSLKIKKHREFLRTLTQLSLPSVFHQCGPAFTDEGPIPVHFYPARPVVSFCFY